jgi:hypothetical protein
MMNSGPNERKQTMSETTNVVDQDEVKDSLSKWLYNEAKAVTRREAEILKTPPGEERNRLLAAIADEFEEILVARQAIQQRREASTEKEIL